MITLFALSSVTKKTDPAEQFRGIFDWRLQLGLLTAITVLLYWRLW
jgi:hypothetical protein